MLIDFINNDNIELTGTLQYRIASRGRVAKRSGVFYRMTTPSYSSLLCRPLPSPSAVYLIILLMFHVCIRLSSAAIATFDTLSLASCAINVSSLALCLIFFSASFALFPPLRSLISSRSVCADSTLPDPTIITRTVYSDLLYLCQPQSAPGLPPSTDRLASRPTLLFPLVFPTGVAGLPCGATRCSPRCPSGPFVSKRKY